MITAQAFTLAVWIGLIKECGQPVPQSWIIDQLQAEGSKVPSYDNFPTNDYQTEQKLSKTANRLCAKLYLSNMDPDRLIPIAYHLTFFKIPEQWKDDPAAEMQKSPPLEHIVTEYKTYYTLMKREESRPTCSLKRLIRTAAPKMREDANR
ncbi:hypothetical protein B0H67DRAFT_681342 [Lasiosphaeris hirsuta]|uniref:Uncharacterized protein n=1 Tax=Lasiosphaeris hirsuta TaxID=260670 RepID=A0AA40ANL0_9PEZI|nr:hypothetical protein B0H67DRAFT_681342 [Lasiosphaeris hirsuta]